MTACKQIRANVVMVEVFSDPGLHIIRFCTVFHRSEDMVSLLFIINYALLVTYL